MNSYEILIPFHSNKLFLTNCVKSLLSTTPNDISITIIANNENKFERSLDFSSERIRVIEIDHSMYYPYCINFGMQFIKSSYVFLIDADTYHLPGWFEQITKLNESCEGVGIIGSALLEMTTNRIKDFGLSFSGCNWAQIYKGQCISSPLIETQKFQAVCTASCLINRKAFLEVDGFSEYCNISYSDIDLCIRLREKGYQVLGCAESKAYHKGNASKRIVPLLKKDCYAIFMAKVFSKMTVDIHIYLKRSCDAYMEHNRIAPQYIMLNFSSILNYSWFKEQLEIILETNIPEIYEYPSDIRDTTTINLVATVHTDIYRNNYPFIYFVDLFSSLTENQFWKELRKTNIDDDIVVDRHGSVCSLHSLLKTES